MESPLLKLLTIYDKIFNARSIEYNYGVPPAVGANNDRQGW